MNQKTDPILAFDSTEAWEAWLAENYATSKGLWLQIAKKGSGTPTVTYAEALDVALCHGWIDGQKDKLDDLAWLQRFTPRGARSRWSKLNTEHVARLVEAGRMKPAGLLEVERAQADGRWEAAYAGQRTAEVPPDLQQALDGNPAAAAAFTALGGSYRYAILYRVHDAKRPETRAKRIERFVTMLNEGTAEQLIRRGQMSLTEPARDSPPG